MLEDCLGNKEDIPSATLGKSLEARRCDYSSTPPPYVDAIKVATAGIALGRAMLVTKVGKDVEIALAH